ncbi:TIGR02301 family protein [uncultured Rhodoblastus sp.]|uniref:TIGR02301 family protein n=1 Tax=uncultured Rhodoblastus sp. TaxID=543037 RepID=UPI0025E77C24|nr:TIGR02301 family protein [uncultured Rhodoblastus sp.]
MGLVLVGGDPARAQFFFPFFDNRPSHPPSAAPRRSVHRSEREAVEPRQKAHRAKERARQEKARKSSKSAKTQSGAGKSEAPAPVVEAPPPPYEPQLLRLSEIMGALAYLQTLCADPAASPAAATSSGASSADAALSKEAVWRDRMQELMSAEGAGPARREKLAGAFNRGLRGYQFSYRVCTPSAQLARRRFLDEGSQIAHDISTQYRAN